MSTHTTSRAFFEDLYLHLGDPWDFVNSEYERGRYQATLQALADRRYRRVFEPGCSVGVLTKELAAISEHIDAIDISSLAAEKAALRCNKLLNVSIRQGALPTDIPQENFDLIVFSEIGYYFDEPRLEALVDRLIDHMQSGSIFLAVHWLGFSPDHVLRGSEVHRIISSSRRIAHEHSEVHKRFVLDRWICK